MRTEDAWHLTIFHITGYKGKNSNTMQKERDLLTGDKYPILSIPGSGSDALSWFKAKKGGKPFHLQLYDNGYDIWLGNNRGT